MFSDLERDYACKENKQVSASAAVGKLVVCMQKRTKGMYSGTKDR